MNRTETSELLTARIAWLAAAPEHGQEQRDWVIFLQGVLVTAAQDWTFAPLEALAWERRLQAFPGFMASFSLRELLPGRVPPEWPRYPG